MTRSTLLRLATAALLLALAGTAPAATVTVAVNGADGQPAPNVVVQLFPANAGAARPPEAARVIAQRDIHFVPFMTAIPVGASVRFSNEDPYDHHLRSEAGGPLGTVAPAKDFEMRLPAATGDKVSSVELKFDRPGAIVLGCHLHSSMRGHLFVSETPWVGVTDASGRAVIAGVPEGAVDVRAWSPEQLVEQPRSTRQVAGAAANVETTLNFTPARSRRRHG